MPLAWLHANSAIGRVLVKVDGESKTVLVVKMDPIKMEKQNAEEAPAHEGKIVYRLK